MKKFHFAAICAGLLLPSFSLADWDQTDAGTYGYNDTANWTGATINGVFSPDLTGDQVVTFNQNTTTPNNPNELNFSYTTDFDINLRSDSATVRTLFMGNGVSSRTIVASGSGGAGSNRTITFEDTLLIDIGSSLKRIVSGNNTHLVMDAKITGAGSLQVSSGGSNSSVTLSNNTNDFTGSFLVGIGRPVRITSIADSGVASAVGAGSSIRFLNGSSATTLEYTGATASTNRGISLESTTNNPTTLIDNVGTGKLTFTGNFTRTANSANNLTLKFQGSQDIEVAGTINNSTGGFSLALEKDGANTLTLSGSNVYTGATTVTAGTLIINGDNSAATGALAVASDATLGGSGTIGGATTISAGATHSPGNSPGIQTFTDGLTYNTSSTLQWELAANTVSGRGTSYDGIDVTGGALTIQTGVTAELVFNALGSTVDFTDAAFWNTDQSWVMFSNSNLPTLDSASIFDSLTTTVDSFGNAFSVTGGALSFSQSGNDVLLNYTAVPEPSSLALLGLGLAFAFRGRQRRRG